MGRPSCSNASPLRAIGRRPRRRGPRGSGASRGVRRSAQGGAQRPLSPRTERSATRGGPSPGPERRPEPRWVGAHSSRSAPRGVLHEGLVARRQALRARAPNAAEADEREDRRPGARRCAEAPHARHRAAVSATHMWGKGANEREQLEILKLCQNGSGPHALPHHVPETVWLSEWPEAIRSTMPLRLAAPSRHTLAVRLCQAPRMDARSQQEADTKGVLSQGDRCGSRRPQRSVQDALGHLGDRAGCPVDRGPRRAATPVEALRLREPRQPAPAPAAFTHTHMERGRNALRRTRTLRVRVVARREARCPTCEDLFLGSAPTPRLGAPDVLASGVVAKPVWTSPSPTLSHRHEAAKNRERPSSSLSCAPSVEMPFRDALERLRMSVHSVAHHEWISRRRRPSDGHGCTVCSQHPSPMSGLQVPSQ